MKEVSVPRDVLVRALRKARAEYVRDLDEEAAEGECWAEFEALAEYVEPNSFDCPLASVDGEWCEWHHVTPFHPDTQRRCLCEVGLRAVMKYTGKGPHNLRRDLDERMEELVREAKGAPPA